MRFEVSSSELLKQLNIASGAINTNPVLPIMEDILFNVKDNVLTITSTNLETTIITSVDVTSDEDGIIAIPAIMLLDTIKALPEQPVTVSVEENNSIRIMSAFGVYKLSIKVQAEAAKAQAEATKALAEAKRIQIELETKRLEDEKRIAQEAEERRREEVRSRLNAKAKQLASEAAPIIVKKYWMGGSDITSRVESVSYDEGSEEYDIDMRINWFGMIVSSNEYWAEGKLRVARDGSFHFTKTGASSGLSDVEGAMGAMKLGILAGAAGSN